MSPSDPVAASVARTVDVERTAEVAGRAPNVVADGAGEVLADEEKTVNRTSKDKEPASLLWAGRGGRTHQAGWDPIGRPGVPRSAAPYCAGWSEEANRKIADGQAASASCAFWCAPLSKGGIYSSSGYGGGAAPIAPSAGHGGAPIRASFSNWMLNSAMAGADPRHSNLQVMQAKGGAPQCYEEMTSSQWNNRNNNAAGNPWANGGPLSGLRGENDSEDSWGQELAGSCGSSSWDARSAKHGPGTNGGRRYRKKVRRADRTAEERERTEWRLCREKDEKAMDQYQSSSTVVAATSPSIATSSAPVGGGKKSQGSSPRVKPKSAIAEVQAATSAAAMSMSAALVKYYAPASSKNVSNVAGAQKRQREDEAALAAKRERNSSAHTTPGADPLRPLWPAPTGPDRPDQSNAAEKRKVERRVLPSSASNASVQQQGAYPLLQRALVSDTERRGESAPISGAATSSGHGQSEPATAFAASTKIIFVDGANVAYAGSGPSGLGGKQYNAYLLLSAYDALVEEYSVRAHVNIVLHQAVLDCDQKHPAIVELFRRDRKVFPKVPSRSSDDAFLLGMALRKWRAGHGVIVISNDNFDRWVEGGGPDAIQGVTQAFLRKVLRKFSELRGEIHLEPMQRSGED